ncbi:hypothetical protein OAN21_01530 [Alphaproteobacteria bacterium]|nr:hypothetical protein [Alphaproteobacteria bacterium]
MFFKKWAILAVAIAAWADSSRSASEEKEVVLGSQAYRSMWVAPGQLLMKLQDGSLTLGKTSPSGHVEVKPFSLPTSVSSTFDAWEGAVFGVHPKYFAGYGTIDPTAVNIFRRQMDSVDRNPLCVTTGPLVQQAIKVFKLYAPGVPVPDGVSVLELYYASTVHAFTFRETSEIEDDVFAHLPDNDRYHAMKVLAEQGNYWFLRNNVVDLMPLVKKVEKRGR